MGAVATASGHAAQYLLMTTLLSPGDQIVSSRTLYGGTHTQFDVTLRRWGIDTVFVDASDPENFRRALSPRTRVLYGETIGNPRLDVLDIGAIARIAVEAHVPLVIDNTFATPALCRPIEHGASIVVESATKYIGGHGTSIGGVIVDSGAFNWDNGLFPLVVDPSPAYHGIRFFETFGQFAFLAKMRTESLRDQGPTLSPFHSFLFLQGLENAHLADGAALTKRPSRSRVPGEPSRRLLGQLSGSAVQSLSPWPSSTCRGMRRYPRPSASKGDSMPAACLSSLALISPSRQCGRYQEPGDPPASTTHQQLSQTDREAAGIGDNLIRLSVGLEDVDDIICGSRSRALALAGMVMSPTAPGEHISDGPKATKPHWTGRRC